MQRGLRNLFGVMLVVGVSLAAAYGQDSEQDASDTEQSPEAQSAHDVPGDQARPEKAGTEPARKTLYFIGPRVRGQRQEGPSVGTPRSITPKPYVPAGSLTIPVPTETASPEPEATNTGELEKVENLDASTAFSERPETNPPLEAVLGAAPEQSTLLAGEPVGGPVETGDPFSEAMLGQIDPSGFAVPEVAPLDTVWQGYTREEIIAFLHKIAQPTLSPVLSRLSGAIAASRFVVPAPEGDASVIEFIEARLAAFESTANIDGYTGLIGILPRDRDWIALAPHFARAHLLKGELTDACLIAENRRAEENDPYWIKLAAFCMAASGNRVGLDFQLGILEETVAIEPVFYQLLDQILIEAELPPGSLIPQPVPLNGPLPAGVLTASMAGLSRAMIGDVEFGTLSPLAVPLLLENPSLSRAAQTKLVGFLMSRGIADETLVKNFAQNFTLEDGEAETALAGTVQKTAVETEVEATSDTVTPVVSDDQTDSVLLALVAGAPSADMTHAALERLWQRSLERGRVAAIAPGLAALSAIVPDTGTPNVSLFDNIGILARANAMTGDTAGFDEFSRRLRVGVANENLERDQALIALWPVLMLSGGSAGPQVDDQQLSLWLQQSNQAEDSALKANLLLPVLEVFGRAVSDDAWQKLAQDTVLFDGKNVSPAFWRSLLKNAEAGDPLKTVESVYDLMRAAGPAQLPPAIVGTVIDSLRRVGLSAAAQALALEILISQGL